MLHLTHLHSLSTYDAPQVTTVIRNSAAGELLTSTNTHQDMTGGCADRGHDERALSPANSTAHKMLSGAGSAALKVAG